MENVITIGSKKALPLAEIFRETCLLLRGFEIPISDGDLWAIDINPNSRIRYDGPLDPSSSCYQLQNQEVNLRIGIVCYETEPPIPGYPSPIRGPYTISLSLFWVGASALTRIIFACLAVAVARQTGSIISDYEHLVSDKDAADAEYVMAKVRDACSRYHRDPKA